MKKVKLMFTALGVLAVVSSALAFASPTDQLYCEPISTGNGICEEAELRSFVSFSSAAGDEIPNLQCSAVPDVACEEAAVFESE